MLLPSRWTTSLLPLLALSTGVLGSEPQTMRLVKRDPSGVPATVSHQNCATRYARRFGSSSSQPFCNPGIQAGECFVNARIHNNVFATFEPDDGPMTAPREGGAYGRCCAYSLMPKEEDLIEVKNANYFCFAWMGPDKDVGAGLPSSGLPGMLAWPHPLICPGPEPNCYSLNYFDAMKSGDNIAQHKLLSSADKYPNTTAFWQPPKRAGKRGTKRPYLWCNGRGLGCPLTTNLHFQTQNLASIECDPTKCDPYKGDMTILQGEDRVKFAVKRGSAVASIESCNPASDPWCGGPHHSGLQAGKGGSGSTTSCDASKDPNCSSDVWPPPTKTTTKCDEKKDPSCGQAPPSKQECDSNGKCKTKTTTIKKPKKGQDCKKTGTCTTTESSSNTNNTGELTWAALTSDGEAEDDSDCDADRGTKEQLDKATKRDRIPCGEPYEECNVPDSHKNRRHLHNKKSGWIV